MSFVTLVSWWLVFFLGRAGVPELPEVETIRCCLLDQVVGEEIHKVRVRRGSRLLRDTVSAGELRKRLQGARIEALGRRGKYLIAALSTGDFLVLHLGMTGRLYTVNKGEKSPAHTHLRFSLGEDDLILVDPRTFGRVLLIAAGGLESHPAIRRLGPEPLDDEFSVEHIKYFLSRRQTSLKALLLGQGLCAGVGNIYADEACFRAGITPLRRAMSLSDVEIRALRKGVRQVIRESIQCKGTTIRDYQWDAGKSGGFASRLRVYGREGRPCRRCGEPVRRETAAGRSTFYCARCQK